MLKPLKIVLVLMIANILWLTVSCTAKSENPKSDSVKESAPEPTGAVGAEIDKAQLVKRGTGVYRANCTACHNDNPKLDGSLGPAVAGSSLELLRARLINGDYPTGYKPKRSTHVMPKLPQLEKELDALTAFLNQ